MVAGPALALLLAASAGTPKIVELWKLGFVSTDRGCVDSVLVFASDAYFVLGTCDEVLGDHVVVVAMSYDRIHGAAFAAADASMDGTSLRDGASPAARSLEYALLNGPALKACGESDLAWAENHPAKGWSFVDDSVTCDALEMLARSCVGEPGTTELLKRSMLPGKVRR
jgi:hypothetical protein